MTFDPEKTYEKEDIASWPPGHRRCRECQEVLPFERFHKHKQCLFGVNTVCKDCRRPKSKKQYSEKTPEYNMWHRAKSRAKKKGILFTITVEDIDIPDVCPVLGQPLVVGDYDWTPSLDQRNPRGGYTPNNIVVISNKANRIKSDATSDEVRAVADWMDVKVKAEPAIVAF